MKFARHPPAGRRIPRSARRDDRDADLAAVWPNLQVHLFGSGTAALGIAIKGAIEALPEGSQRRVALPAYGCPNLLAAARWAGGEPVYYDLRPDTLAPEPELLRALLSDGDHIVVHVDAFGLDTLSWLGPLADSAGMRNRLVHDLAQSFAPFAAHWRPHSPRSVLSFGRAKPASLTMGGALLSTAQANPRTAVSKVPEIAMAAWQCAARSTLYSLSLRAGLFGLLSRIPALGIGQTKFVPLDAVGRLAGPWPGAVSAAALHVRRNLDAYRGDSMTMLHLARDAGLTVPGATRPGVDQMPLWRVPVLCATSRDAGELAARGAHLGVSRLYGRSIPEIMGMSAEEASRQWPNAVSIASRLITLPTHGRLDARARAELQALLAACAA